MTVSDLLEQPCNRSVTVRIQLVDGLLADLLQDVRFLRVYAFQQPTPRG